MSPTVITPPTSSTTRTKMRSEKSNPNPNQRQELARARSLTDRLFRKVRPEAYFDRPIPERHRILFYIGHLEAFDWNLIGKNGLGSEPISEELDKLFAFGIDPPVGQLPQDQPSDWPSVEQARQYVEAVRKKLDSAMEAAPPEMIDMALEHRLMHAETFTYILHNLPYTRKILENEGIAGSGPSLNQKSLQLQMKEVSAGTVTLGMKHEDGFGWDNEFEQHTQDVSAFAMSKHKITNGQYLEFVKAGGQAPHYWLCRNDQWSYRGMNAEVPLPLDWPVYVTQSQAEACAQWMGKSLPTEEQFHRAAFGAEAFETEQSQTEKRSEQIFPWGNEPADAHFGNFNYYNADLVPVTATPAGDSAFGISQLVGNGWEWTRSLFKPFPGFAASPSYPGYSANFFDDDHFVLKGASCSTDAHLIRPSFRNWFRRDYPYAYTTFRVVEN
jgi:gamma-glutamyl hercynylcysteine S-oxide synthase